MEFGPVTKWAGSKDFLPWTVSAVTFWSSLAAFFLSPVIPQLIDPFSFSDDWREGTKMYCQYCAMNLQTDTSTWSISCYLRYHEQLLDSNQGKRMQIVKINAAIHHIYSQKSYINYMHCINMTLTNLTLVAKIQLSAPFHIFYASIFPLFGLPSALLTQVSNAM